MKPMPENDCLQLIVEAVKYCQSVSMRGMPISCYTKALREPVYFLWESYGRNKSQAAKYCSASYLQTHGGGKDRIYDHAIPFKIVQSSLLRLDAPDPDSVRQILESQLVACLITKEEDKLLTSLGLRSRMPEGSDESNCLARYELAGIKVVPNPDYIK